MKKLIATTLALTVYLCSFAQSDTDSLSVIVRLNHKLLNFEVVDNESITGGRIQDFLNAAGKKELAQLNTAMFDNLYFKKSFGNMKTKDSLSVSRTGQVISVPPFWATFKVSAINGESMFRYLAQLQHSYPVVIYAHPNYALTFDAFPNDSLYGNQLSLQSTAYPNAHINVEPAWGIETGKKFIKVGVFDTGIDTTHADLNPAILTGWAYNNFDTIIPSEWGVDRGGTRGHGTEVAGIIGAKRNNTTGVAGIAGGDGNDTTGVSLIDFRLAPSWNAETASRAVIDAARSVGTYYDWTTSEVIPPINDEWYWRNASGYGIHIGNHSYGFRLTFNRKDSLQPGLYTGNLDKSTNDSLPIVDVYDFINDCLLCRESFLFSLKNGVVSVVSRGNGSYTDQFGLYGQNDKFPSNYDDSWVISVGGSGTNGEWFDGNNGFPAESNFFTQIGREVDIVAPATQALVYSTASVFAFDTTGTRYSRFSGTSAAAPHASGVAALLLSKYNKNCYSNVNLDPADVEYILQKSAVDVNAADYDEYTGWGRLDAHKALQMIDFPEYQIVHPIDLPVSSQLFGQDTITLWLNRPLRAEADGPLGGDFPLQIETYYRVERRQYELTYDFSQYQQPSTEFLDAWVRQSQTNSVEYVSDTMSYWVDPTTIAIDVDTIDIEPYAKITNVDPVAGTIKLRGFYYHFIRRHTIQDDYNSVTVPENFWYPINPNVTAPKMAYSVYIRDSLAVFYDFPCDSANIPYDSLASVYNLQNEQFDFMVYPNPSDGNALYVLLNDGNFKAQQLMIYDISGSCVANQAIRDNKKTRQLDVSGLQSGVYFVHLRTADNRILTKKWIKL